ncbi:bifunctional [glutamate--ammonia ligase]-adenylyl-L-tyrosine phosphorylase/[glutamate--ammonia-ligase] adenylyltransferase, partial [bacterium]
FEDLTDQIFGLARRPDFPLGKLTRERYPRFAEAFAGALFDAADPSMAARLIGQFFARLETPSVYAKLFEGEPRALLRFVSLTGGSSELGERLVGHPELVDGIVFATAEDPSAPLPAQRSLEKALENELVRARAEYGEGDEAVVAASRRLKSETTVRVGVRDLGGETTTEGVASALTDLADVIVRTSLLHAARRGPPFADGGPVRGLAAMAMGKYGGRELSYGSDLDLFFVFDPAVFEDHEDAPYRLATRLLRLLSTAHGEGPGYELDTRLRPSGNQGLLVTSEAAFARYHGHAGPGESAAPAKAEAWERQALIKTRFVAGDPALGARTAKLAEQVAYGGGAPDRARVVELRLRMEGEQARHAGANVIDIKLGPGGLVDIEFLAQTLQMQHGADRRARASTTEGALRALWQIGALGDDEAQMLLRHHAFFRRLEQRLRIVYGRSDTLVV